MQLSAQCLDIQKFLSLTCATSLNVTAVLLMVAVLPVVHLTFFAAVMYVEAACATFE